MAAKTTKTAAEAAADTFAGAFQNAEIPAALKDAADRTLTQAKDVYARAKTAAEEAGDLMDATFETARANAKAFGAKAFEAAQVNAEATFAFARELLGAKTMADAFELQTAFARKQFETATAQFRELQEVSQKAFIDAAKPAREAAEKAYRAV